MKILSEMSKDERSLLLFLETAAVDHGGLFDARHMNKADMDIAEGWSKEGFLPLFRRVPACLLGFYRDKGCFNHYVRLSEDAWRLAQQERRERGARLAKKVIEKMEAAQS